MEVNSSVIRGIEQHITKPGCNIKQALRATRKCDTYVKHVQDATLFSGTNKYYRGKTVDLADYRDDLKVLVGWDKGDIDLNKRKRYYIPDYVAALAMVLPAAALVTTFTLPLACIGVVLVCSCCGVAKWFNAQSQETALPSMVGMLLSRVRDTGGQIWDLRDNDGEVPWFCCEFDAESDVDYALAKLLCLMGYPIFDSGGNPYLALYDPDPILGLGRVYAASDHCVLEKSASAYPCNQVGFLHFYEKYYVQVCLAYGNK